MGLLFALSVVLSFLEGTLTPLLGLPPGVKLGLANVVVMYALFFLGRGSAFTLVPVSYTHLRAHETRHDLVCRLLLEKIFFNDTATTEIYTLSVVGSVRCV